MAIVVGTESATQQRILVEAVCVFLHANLIGKGMNICVLPSPCSGSIGQTEIFSISMPISLVGEHTEFRSALLRL